MLYRIVKAEPPAIIPAGWLFLFNHQGKPSFSRGVPAGIWQVTPNGLKAIYSLDTLDDGACWRHISFSRDNRYPGWDEMMIFIRLCKLFNPQENVVMVLPPAIRHMNEYPNCFHWWQKEKGKTP